MKKCAVSSFKMKFIQSLLIFSMIPLSLSETTTEEIVTEKSKQERQALLSQPKESSAVLLGQMLRQFLEANFRKLSFELNSTQANIYHEISMLQSLEKDVKTIQQIVSQLDMIKKTVADVRFISDIFADTQYIKESQQVNGKKQLDTLLQLIHLSYSGALMLGDIHDRLAKKLNCLDIRDNGKNASGVYTVWPQGIRKVGVEVYCDMDTDGGGWTVIQRRGHSSYGTSRQVNFNQTWDAYVNGFGDASADYWFGLENLRGLTKLCPYELLINLTSWDGETRYAFYDKFYIGSGLDMYRLNVESHSGTVEDSLLYHHKKQFSTYDHDNDDNWGETNGNCAETYGGGWWFGDCLRSNLNGKYFQNDEVLRKDKLNGIRWNSWTGMKESLKMAEMKIRPKCGFFSFS